MEVSVIGAGSIGMLFAAYLHQVGIKLKLYTRTEEQAKKLNDSGLILKNGGDEQRLLIEADVLLPNSVLSEHFVIVAVKQHQLSDIMPVIQNNRHAQYLFVQNGMGHLSSLKELQNDKILLGIVEHGAMKIAENLVEHTGIGQVRIASMAHHVIDEPTASFIQSWVCEHFPITIENDWYTMLANKLVANAVINPLTAIFGVKNGTLLSNEYFLKLMHQLYAETMLILNIPSEGVWENLLSICEKTAGNESSMLRDIQAKRKTEIEAINGYILSLANEKNERLPYTEFVVNSIKGLEETSFYFKKGKHNAYR